MARSPVGRAFIGGLVWYFNRTTSDLTKSVETAAAATKDAAANATSSLSDATKAAWAKLGDLFNRKLPDGTVSTSPAWASRPN